MYIQHEIKFSNKKLYFYLVSGLIFIILGFLCQQLFKDSVVGSIEFIIITPFYLLLIMVGFLYSFLIIKKIVKKDKVAIVLLDDKIIEQTSIFKSPREYFYKDIISFEEREIGTSPKQIVVTVKNIEDYKQYLPFKKVKEWMLEDDDYFFTASPLYLNTKYLETNHYQVLQLLQTTLTNYNNK